MTTTVQVHVTTTVEAAPTVEAGPALPTTDPDDVDGPLDVRNFNATRTGDLIAVSLTTYESWSSSVLASASAGKQGANRVTILYDVDLDGKADYRGRVISAGGSLTLFISGQGSQFEPVPVERPDSTSAQYVHPVEVFFTSFFRPIKGGEIQLQAQTAYQGAEDQAPDAGRWLRVSTNP